MIELQTASFLDEIAEYANQNKLNRQVPPGGTLFREGETSTELYVLIKGAVSVLIGGVKIATIREVGSIIGEVSTLLGQTRMATIRVEEPAEFVVLTPDQFAALLEDHPRAGLLLARMLAQRVVNDAKRIGQEKRKLQQTIDEHEKFLKIAYELSKLAREKSPSAETEAFHDLMMSNSAARQGIAADQIQADRLPSWFRRMI